MDIQNFSSDLDCTLTSHTVIQPITGFFIFIVPHELLGQRSSSDSCTGYLLMNLLMKCFLISCSLLLNVLIALCQHSETHVIKQYNHEDNVMEKKMQAKTKARS